MPPRVSVLIGAYDNEPTVGRAIDSILAQTEPDLELIVVDDGSTDGTGALVDAYEDRRVRRLALPHMGISRSLNAGLAETTAPVVAIQDADDWSEPERLERELAVLDARPDVAVVGCRMHEVDEDGRPLRPRTSFAPGDVRDVLMRFNPIPNSCAAYRRDVVLAAGGYPVRWRYTMEYALWLRIADAHGVWTIDEPLATRQMSRTNVAARKERAQLAETLAIRVEAMRRRRSLHGASHLALPAISWATPLPVKRAVRRRIGMAP